MILFIFILELLHPRGLQGSGDLREQRRKKVIGSESDVGGGKEVRKGVLGPVGRKRGMRGVEGVGVVRGARVYVIGREARAKGGLFYYHEAVCS